MKHINILPFYELDLGLNHVARKWPRLILNVVDLLVMVRGGGHRPSGVLVCVCAENFVIYKNQGHPNVLECMFFNAHSQYCQI